MHELSPDQLAFDKAADGLLPAIVQDARTRTVLMQGYMNRESLDVTLQKGLVTFFSRSKQRLWTKGESSGNVLKLVSIHPDCDQDSLLVLAEPVGPTCHTGDDTCWGEVNRGDFWITWSGPFNTAGTIPVRKVTPASCWPGASIR
jgi:phosphoribosyl-ATP pyrophosphohydrolase/phosphoribosyl-AMP cyclohydrolase